MAAPSADVLPIPDDPPPDAVADTLDRALTAVANVADTSATAPPEIRRSVVGSIMPDGIRVSEKGVIEPCQSPLSALIFGLIAHEMADKQNGHPALDGRSEAWYARQDYDRRSVAPRMRPETPYSARFARV